MAIETRYKIHEITTEPAHTGHRIMIRGYAIAYADSEAESEKGRKAFELVNNIIRNNGIFIPKEVVPPTTG